MSSRACFTNVHGYDSGTVHHRDETAVLVDVNIIARVQIS